MARARRRGPLASSQALSLAPATRNRFFGKQNSRVRRVFVIVSLFRSKRDRVGERRGGFSFSCLSFDDGRTRYGGTKL